MKNSLYIFLTFILFCLSCHVRTSKIQIVGSARECPIEIYNGKNLILKDTVSTSAITGNGIGFYEKINFREPISVKILYSDTILTLSENIRPKKMIYIELGAGARIFSQNEMYGGY